MRSGEDLATPVVAPEPSRLRVVEDPEARLARTPGFELSRLPGCDAVVLSKLKPGVDKAAAKTLGTVVELAGSGRLGRPKYLVLDFTHPAHARSRGAFGVAELSRELRNLVLRVPVVPVAFVRSCLTGGDLELAFSCNMIIAEQGAAFDFGMGPDDFSGLYALLAEKIGFVRTERLLEPGLKVGAEVLKEQLLVRELAPPGTGHDFLGGYLGRHLRRHNSFHSIYRAQRMVGRPGETSLTA